MITIVTMEPSHWPDVKRIYQEGIKTKQATFETEAPEWEQWNSAHLKTCRLVALEEKKVLGWAALSPVSGRCVYGGVAEVSVYLDSEARGKGLGKKMLAQLIIESEANNLWTLQSGIFPENIASVKMHTDNGFRVVGNRVRIGQLDGVWKDTILLERRSTKNGI